MDRFKVLGKLQDVVGFLHNNREILDVTLCPNDTIKNFIELKLSPYSKKIISMLYSNGDMNQRTIAKNNFISSQAVSKILVKLEENQIISKKYGTQKNENIISLTDKGSDIAKYLQERIKLNSEMIFKNISDDEMISLEKIFDKIIENNRNKEEI